MTPWTVARQTPLSMGFSRQEYWSGLPFSSTSDLPDPWIQPRSPALQADSLPSEPPGKPVLNRSQSLFSLPNFLLLLSLHKHLTPLNLHALSCLPNPSPSGDQASLSTCPTDLPRAPRSEAGGEPGSEVWLPSQTKSRYH